MKTISEEQQKMFDWDNELRFGSINYSDTHVVDVAQMAMDFAYENMAEKETIFHGFLHRYESEIENVALGIDSYLQKNAMAKKSLAIKTFVLDVINNEKYGRGRSGFIFLLSVLRMDNELKDIATRRNDFWETPRIQFQLLYALYKRKIKGFSNKAEKLMMNNPKETELKKYASKYIEQETKWK